MFHFLLHSVPKRGACLSPGIRLPFTKRRNKIERSANGYPGFDMASTVKFQRRRLDVPAIEPSPVSSCNRETITTLHATRQTYANRLLVAHPSHRTEYPYSSTNILRSTSRADTILAYPVMTNLVMPTTRTGNKSPSLLLCGSLKRSWARVATWHT